MPGAPREDDDGTDRGSEPDLSSAARALAAFVAYERRPLGVEPPPDGEPDFGDHEDARREGARSGEIRRRDRLGAASGPAGAGDRPQDDPDDPGEPDEPDELGDPRGLAEDFDENHDDVDDVDEDRDGGQYRDSYREDGPYPGSDQGFSRPYAHEFGPRGEHRRPAAPSGSPGSAAGSAAGSGSPAGGAPRGVAPRGISPRGVAPRAESPRMPMGDLFASASTPPPGPPADGHEAAPVPDDVPDHRVHVSPSEATFGGTPAARVALVTGAGRGIGRAIALGLGRAGLSVALLGRSPDALEEVAARIASYGVGASWAGADVRDYAQVHNAVERLEAALGEIDLLVNNAGVIEPVEVPVWEAGPETWWHVVETDLRGPFHCVRAVVPGMVERGGGRVINLNSGAGARDRDVYSAYGAAKAGLFRITGSLHQAGYRRGVRAFEISPGVVRTDMTATMAMHAGRQDWTPGEAIVELVVAVAAGRLDAWSGGFLRAGVDTVESLDAAELKAGEEGLPPTARRLGILPYGPGDPLVQLPLDARMGPDRSR